MKKDYQKPIAEIIDFDVNESIMDINIGGGGGNSNISGGVDDDFFG